ncbi:MAG: prepilin-type N-terminal cleavage/methylation domain-containing protein [Rhodoferax sp.]|nr:prepilin-type N-terminal cleavage/methylation domain-containing protein [Rhodoferax sp.]
MSPHAPPLHGSLPPQGAKSARGGPARICGVAHRGFTLIELLVAISIMAVMTLMAWRGLDGMQSATQNTRAHADAVLTLETGLAQWSADLDAMVAPSALPGAPTAMDWDGRVLRVTRRNSTEAGDGLLVVAWTRGNRDGIEQWLRWQSAPLRLQQDWQTAWTLAGQWAQSPSDSAKKQEVAIAALDQWQIYYYRGGAWSNPLSSSGTPTSDTVQPVQRSGLPDGIRLVLGVATPHPLSGVLTRDWAQPTLTGSAQ